MKNSAKYIRTKLALLTFLILLVAHFGTQANTVSACQECVFPTGGICVGCTVASENGYVNCEPDQSTCSCRVSGGSCSSGGYGGLEP